ncbi:hypothetical protein BCR44DRAFT_1437844 [Catenaria anguillulae PL171]|uniref:Uncharacterized protein n=1 Tax=Catenaria anguillulae PL171 TaxID=765915 RepID=A0A1Y2HGF8_9FUNG|nr:hypothetical protein BCR44DRAFT_1437844 [Catenaria anguillulae PL171]
MARRRPRPMRLWLQRPRLSSLPLDWSASAAGMCRSSRWLCPMPSPIISVHSTWRWMRAGFAR